MRKRTLLSESLCLCGLLSALPAQAEVGRVIVKYRGDSGVQAKPSDAARKRLLRAETGLRVLGTREFGGRLHALQVDGVGSSELARRFEARADVEFAVPDERRYISTVPTDPLYGQEWYLHATEVAAIDAQTAWDTTTGSSNVVVAVLDTGILGSHPDLTGKLTRNNGTLYGYDFVSDADVANDGDCWDADPSDPGDYITSEEAATGFFAGCYVGDSSWHGSLVAGIIGASSNNALGVAGVAWGAKVLPVRVLGKCGGYDSDILAGMLWAAGLPVESVSNNLYPAKIINLSLGGSGSCTAAYVDTIAQIEAAGALVIAAAGNDSASVGVPANCPGVVAVAALSHSGSRAFYSSYGTEVGIAAPGGDCGWGHSCAYPFYSTKDSGSEGPCSSNYSLAADVEIGTSFSSPLVAGVAALMRSVNSGLTPPDLVSRLKSGATPFPADSELPDCDSVVSGDYSDCNCTTSTCGAGMLNAASAVNEALRPVAALSVQVTAEAGSNIALIGDDSSAADGFSIASHQWTTTAGLIADPTAADASLVVNSAGTVTATLTVTDSAGRTDSASADITITGNSGNAGADGGAAGSAGTHANAEDGGSTGALVNAEDGGSTDTLEDAVGTTVLADTTDAAADPNAADSPSPGCGCGVGAAPSRARGLTLLGLALLWIRHRRRRQ